MTRTTSFSSTTFVGPGDKFAIGTVASPAVAYSKTGVAIGGGAQASANFTTAVGFNAIASGLKSTAVGKNALASGTRSVAVGINATALGGGVGSVSVGARAEASNGSISFGSDAKTDSKKSVALGRLADARGASNIAVGYMSKVVATHSFGIAFGSYSKAKTSAIAFGYNSTAYGTGSIAMGANAVVTNGHDFSVALGSGATSTDANQLTIRCGSNSHMLRTKFFVTAATLTVVDPTLLELTAAPADYFSLTLPSGTHYFWISNGTNTDPTPGGTGHAVTYNATAQTLSNNIRDTINTVSGLNATNGAGTLLVVTISSPFTVSSLSTSDAVNLALAAIPLLALPTNAAFTVIEIGGVTYKIILFSP